VRFTYTGAAEQIYPQYRDLGNDDGTLVAKPGEVHDIEPAEGQTVPTGEYDDGQPTYTTAELPMPPDDRWKPVKAAPAPKTKNSED
jgi:hypothetical protein